MTPGRDKEVPPAHLASSYPLPFIALAGLATGAVLSFFGVIHAYVLTLTGVQNKFGLGAAKAYSLAYLIAAILLVALHYYNRVGASERTGIIA